MVRESSADFLSLDISVWAAEVSFPTNLLSGLRSCRRINLFLSSRLAGFFGILHVPKVSLFSRGSEILGGTAPCLRAMYWEFFSMPSCLVVRRLRRSLGISYLISDGINFVSVFPPYFVEESFQLQMGFSFLFLRAKDLCTSLLIMRTRSFLLSFK